MEKAYFSAIVFSFVPFGAVYPFLVALTCAFLAGLTLWCQVLPAGSEGLERFNRRVTGLVIAVFGWIVFQAWQFSGNQLANPIWTGPIAGLGDVAGAISVNPAATRGAMITLATPCFAALAALRIFREDAAVLRLWSFLANFGVSLVALTLLQDLLFPHTILLYEKWAYTSDFTLTFVNRNTAATAIGVILLLNIGILLRKSVELRRDQFFSRLAAFDFTGRDKYGQFLLRVAICFLIFIALALTRSRAGIGSTLLGGLALGAIVLTQSPPAAFQNRRFARAIAACLMAVTLFIFIMLFAGLAVERVAEEGLEDAARLCTYQSVVRAIGDHWLLGWGFGTFGDVFPSYRDATCSGINGIWDRAHNSYLEFVMGTGVFGILPLVTVITLIGSTLLKGLSIRRSLRFMPTASFSILVLVSVHSAVDFSLQIPGFAVFATASLVCGLIASVNSII